ncbi:MAG: hypothetical protein J7M20_01050 [Deltaproteobacteria bacterium]|nr:hypothetical protein [Deltaproteobacteria bacterium]
MNQHRHLMLLTLWLIAILVCLNLGCSNEDSKTVPQPKIIRGFAFFDLGANSHYSSAVRRKLGEKLGSDAISRQNVIDLTLYSNAFFKKHFPQLFNLNRQLNLPEGQRIEHNTTKLMYRYARLKETPFMDIMLYFSNDTGKPLFFKISAGPGAAAIVEAIKEKYGPPEQFEWDNKDGRTLFWKDGKDSFIVSLTQDRLGNPVYLFCIYYVNNLEEMLAMEKAGKLTEQEKVREAGESAF